MSQLCSVLVPNITGTIDITDAYFSSATGVFQQGGVTTRGTGANIAADNRYSVSLDSSRINSIYSGNKLQPKALQALIIIKTWAAGGWTVVALPNKEPPLFAFIFKTTWWSLSPACKFELNWLVKSEAEKQPVYKGVIAACDPASLALTRPLAIPIMFGQHHART